MFISQVIIYNLLTTKATPNVAKRQWFFFFELIMQLILINCNNADNVYFCGFLLLVQKKLFNRSLEGVFLTFVRSIYLSIYLSYIIYIYCIYIIHL